MVMDLQIVIMTIFQWKIKKTFNNPSTFFYLLTKFPKVLSNKKFFLPLLRKLEKSLQFCKDDVIFSFNFQDAAKNVSIF